MKSRILVCVCGADGKKPRYNRVFTGTIHHLPSRLAAYFCSRCNFIFRTTGGIIRCYAAKSTAISIDCEDVSLWAMRMRPFEKPSPVSHVQRFLHLYTTAAHELQSAIRTCPLYCQKLVHRRLWWRTIHVHRLPYRKGDLNRRRELPWCRPPKLVSNHHQGFQKISRGHLMADREVQTGDAAYLVNVLPRLRFT